MADPNLEFFSYELFNRLWLDYGLISEPFPRCFRSQGNEESLLTDDIVNAVKFRQAMFHNCYKPLFKKFYEDFEWSTSDFQDFLVHKFPHSQRPDVFVMEKILSVCAFVAEMCQFCHSKGDDFYLSKCYLNVAVYVNDRFSCEFNKRGGWYGLNLACQWYVLPFLFLKEHSTTRNSSYGENYICHRVHKTINAISVMKRFNCNSSSPESNTTLEWVDYSLQEKPGQLSLAQVGESRKIRNYNVKELEDAILTLKRACNPTAWNMPPSDNMCMIVSENELPPKCYSAISKSTDDKNQNSSSGEGDKDVFKVSPLPVENDTNGGIDADFESHDELLTNQLSKSNLNSCSSAVEISTYSKTSRSKNLARQQNNSREDLKIHGFAVRASLSELNSADDLQSAIKSLNDDLQHGLMDGLSNIDLNSSTEQNPYHETEISITSRPLQPAKNHTSVNMNSSNKSPDNVLRRGLDNVLSDIFLNQSSLDGIKISPNHTRNSVSERKRRSGGKENSPSNIINIQSSTAKLSPSTIFVKPPSSPKAYEVKKDKDQTTILSNLDLNSSSHENIEISPNHTPRNSGVERRYGGKENSPSNVFNNQSSTAKLSPAIIFLDPPSSPNSSEGENNRDQYAVELPGIQLQSSFQDGIHHFPSPTRILGAERKRISGGKESSFSNNQSPRSKLSPARLLELQSIRSTTVAKEDKDQVTCEVMEHEDSESTRITENEFPSTPNNAKMEKNKEQIIAKVMEKSRSMYSELIFEDPSPRSSNTADVKNKGQVGIQKDCQSTQTGLFHKDPSPSSNTAEKKGKSKVGIQVEDCQSTTHTELASQSSSETELPRAQNTSTKNKKKKKKKTRKTEPTLTETTRQDQAAKVEDVQIVRRMILVLGSASGLQFIKSTLKSKASDVSEPPIKNDFKS